MSCSSWHQPIYRPYKAVKCQRSFTRHVIDRFAGFVLLTSHVIRPIFVLMYSHGRLGKCLHSTVIFVLHGLRRIQIGYMCCGRTPITRSLCERNIHNIWTSIKIFLRRYTGPTSLAIYTCMPCKATPSLDVASGTLLMKLVA